MYWIFFLFRFNAGEVLTRTAGIWHTGCFKQNYTTAELEEICNKLGFNGTNANQLTPSRAGDQFTSARPVLTPFEVVWIRKQSGNRLNFGLRTGYDPYVMFMPDTTCFRLFLACMQNKIQFQLFIRLFFFLIIIFKFNILNSFNP